MNQFETRFATVLILLLSTVIVTAAAEIGVGKQELRPTGRKEYRMAAEQLVDGGLRRRLAPFQVCLECKCCAVSDPGSCSTMPCCFGIDCQLPNKPYGVCAFVPKACNCTSCAA